MKKSDLDRLVYAAIADGLKSAAGVRAYVGQHGGAASVAEVREAVRRLRYAGRIRLDRMEINRIGEVVDGAAVVPAAPSPSPAPAPAPGGSSLGALVRAEAVVAGERRQRARNTGTVAKPLDKAGTGPLTPAETVVTLFLEEPGDLYAMVRRRWPELLGEVIVRARAEGISPVLKLVETIEAGIAA